MESTQLLRQRSSCPRLAAPGPNAAQVAQLLEAATSAPDHGRLRPWRFVVIEGADRDKLGRIFAKASLVQQPDLTTAALERVRDKPKRAPLIIVVVAEVTKDHKIPVIEQIEACACAAEHIMLAAFNLGLGAMWRTGAMARHPQVKQALGFASKDEIVGFIYLGTTDKPWAARTPLDYRQFVRELP